MLRFPASDANHVPVLGARHRRQTCGAELSLQAREGVLQLQAAAHLEDVADEPGVLGNEDYDGALATHQLAVDAQQGRPLWSVEVLDDPVAEDAVEGRFRLVRKGIRADVRTVSGERAIKPESLLIVVEQSDLHTGTRRNEIR